MLTIMIYLLKKIQLPVNLLQKHFNTKDSAGKIFIENKSSSMLKRAMKHIISTCTDAIPNK